MNNDNKQQFIEYIISKFFELGCPALEDKVNGRKFIDALIEYDDPSISIEQRINLMCGLFIEKK